MTGPLSLGLNAAPLTKSVSPTMDGAAAANAEPDSATSPSECDHVQDEGTVSAMSVTV